MDMLAQRKSTGCLGGDILVNGAPPGADFVRQCAYVPQFDNFVPVMTAHEVRRAHVRAHVHACMHVAPGCTHTSPRRCAGAPRHRRCLGL